MVQYVLRYVPGVTWPSLLNTLSIWDLSQWSWESWSYGKINKMSNYWPVVWLPPVLSYRQLRRCKLDEIKSSDGSLWPAGVLFLGSQIWYSWESPNLCIWVTAFPYSTPPLQHPVIWHPTRDALRLSFPTQSWASGWTSSTSEECVCASLLYFALPLAWNDYGLPQSVPGKNNLSGRSPGRVLWTLLSHEIKVSVGFS